MKDGGCRPRHPWYIAATELDTKRKRDSITMYLGRAAEGLHGARLGVYRQARMLPQISGILIVAMSIAAGCSVM